MAIRKFNIDYLLQGGKRINPIDLIINYRLVREVVGNIVVSIFGITNNLGIVCLGKAYLFKSIVLNYNTDILLINPKMCTGLWIEFDNAESVEIKSIETVYNEASKMSGRKTICGVLNPVIISDNKIRITAEVGTTIVYETTRDGTEPIDPLFTSSIYSIPIDLSDKLYVKAVAYKDDEVSSISSLSWSN